MPEPRSVPINAKFEDDFITQLVFVLETDTMREVAAKVAHHVVGKRQPARVHSKVCPPNMTPPGSGRNPCSGFSRAIHPDPTEARLGMNPAGPSAPARGPETIRRQSQEATE